LRLDSAGFIERRVAGIVSPSEGYITIDVGNGAGSAIPFFPQPEWAVSPHGTRVGTLTNVLDTTEPYFRVVIVDETGGEIFDRSFPFSPEPIEPAARDSAIGAYAHRRARDDESVVREVEAALQKVTPTVYAAASEILVGTDDRIWIAMRPTAQGTRWLVLSATGEPQGEVLLPPAVRLRDAGSDYVLATERDEFDVESVVRYRFDTGASNP